MSNKQYSVNLPVKYVLINLIIISEHINTKNKTKNFFNSSKFFAVAASTIPPIAFAKYMPIITSIIIAKIITIKDNLYFFIKGNRLLIAMFCDDFFSRINNAPYLNALIASNLRFFKRIELMSTIDVFTFKCFSIIIPPSLALS
jgi:hypothetical protein